MRLVLSATLLMALACGFWSAVRAQNSPPLAPYVPPPSSTPLAPLANDPTALPADPPLGQVRAKSAASSNITAADTRSPIAPALPDPGSALDTPASLLRAARDAITAGKTGTAQEALERAESRLLSRDVAPSEAGTAMGGAMIGSIGQARQALSVGNAPAAIRAIDAALQSS